MTPARDVGHGGGGGRAARGDERPRALRYVGPERVEAAIRAAGRPAAAGVSLALHGPRGSGKATAAADIVEAMYGADAEDQDEYVLRVEGGAGVGIDFARGELGRFARRVRHPRGLPRTLILRRASPALQAALRQSIEDHAETLRVLFVVDRIDDLTPAIRSRCLPLAIPPHTAASFARLLPPGLDPDDALARSRGNLTVARTIRPGPGPAMPPLGEAVCQLMRDPEKGGDPGAWGALRTSRALRASDVADALSAALVLCEGLDGRAFATLSAALWSVQRADAGLAWSSPRVADETFAGVARACRACRDRDCE